MDNHVIEQVREANNIVDVVSAYVPLKRSGPNYKGLCPFHEDRNPSMMVSEVKQIFKCFVCGKGGNVFTFVQEYEKISFPEAVKKLAQRVGITVQESANDKRVESKKSKFLNMYRIANEFYVENLRNHGDLIYRYLENRKISRKLAEKLEIGYALNSNLALYNQFKKRDIDLSLIDESGLVRQGQSGRYDLFRERVMFPIHSHTGQIIAFGGRKLDDSQSGGKYVNSPTTEIYTKGNELYGLFLTKYDIAKLNYVLVCEGYMDFLRLYTEGFTNSVASLGTALTEQQLKLLSRYTKNIHMIYDGDSAGQKAAVNASLRAIEMGYNPKIVQMPSTEDPDSFLIKFGAEALKAKIADATPFLQFVRETSILAPDNKEKIKLLMQSASTMSNGIDREIFVKEIAEEFNISERALNSSSTQPKRQKSTARVKPDFTLNKFPEEQELIQYLINNPSEIKNVCNILNSGYFFVEIYKNMYNCLTEIDDLLTLSSHSQTIDFFTTDKLKNKATELILMGDPGRNILNIINDVKLRKLKHDLLDLNRQINKEGATVGLIEQKKIIKNQIQQLDMAIVNNLLT